MSRQLRDAARSCNEWRDTLFCTGLLALGIAATEWHLPFNVSYLFWGVVFRELCRGLAWHTVNQRYALTALAGTAIAVLMRDAALVIETGDLHAVIASNAVSIGMMLSVLSLVVASSGGLKGAVSAYRRTLFDWPRKICPPRKPNRHRVLEHLLGSWRGLAGAAGPLMKPSPAGR